MADSENNVEPQLQQNADSSVSLESLMREQMARFAHQQLESFGQFGILDLPKASGAH